MEGFSLRNTNIKKEPFARIGEEIEWNETLKKELLDLKLIQETIDHRDTNNKNTIKGIRILGYPNVKVHS